ncbi:methyltransferase domain-containing protein [Micromonospora craniellae]|uniref:methyltransferase domain-containing protein n=1 Tax=Micromonospora craniellae TaxID=2294034 RepID=UPI0018F19C0A|nr:class I SAM-dependent methyltransferase [Micromonospora craniellae]
MTDTGAGPDTRGYLDYLLTNRNFSAPAVAAAIAAIELNVPNRPLRVLDAGTGAGGALPELIAAVRGRSGHGGTVVAVDAAARAVEAAGRRLDDLDLDGVTADLRVGDLRDVVAEATAAGDRFDLIWSSDVIWPATFDDPAAVVQALAEALVPGGTLALFTSNYYQSMFLPGHSRLERLIRTASELTWRLPGDGPTHYERLGAWMRAAGLVEVTIGVHPIAAPVSDPAARAFLEQTVWPEMRHAVSSNGRAAGMSETDIARAGELLDPDSSAWVGNDPDGYVVQPALLWTGRSTIG